MRHFKCPHMPKNHLSVLFYMDKGVNLGPLNTPLDKCAWKHLTGCLSLNIFYSFLFIDHDCWKNMHRHINWSIGSNNKKYGSKFLRQKWQKSIRTVIWDAYRTARKGFTDATFLKQTYCRCRYCWKSTNCFVLTEIFTMKFCRFFLFCAQKSSNGHILKSSHRIFF